MLELDYICLNFLALDQVLAPTTLVDRGSDGAERFWGVFFRGVEVIFELTLRDNVLVLLLHKARSWLWCAFF